MRAALLGIMLGASLPAMAWFVSEGMHIQTAFTVLYAIIAAFGLGTLAGEAKEKRSRSTLVTDGNATD